MADRTIIFRGLIGPTIKGKGEITVKRWHILPVQQNETVATHVYDVMGNAWAIGRILALLGYKNKINMLTLLEGAMVHDVEELVTGDIPHTFKKDFKPKMRRMLAEQTKKSAFKIIKGRFPLILSGLMLKRWSDCQEGKTLEAQIIKVADFLSAINFLENEVLGLSNNRVRERLTENIKELITYRKRYPWLVEVWPLIFGQTPEELSNKIKELQAHKS